MLVNYPNLVFEVFPAHRLSTLFTTDYYQKNIKNKKKMEKKKYSCVFRK